MSTTNPPVSSGPYAKWPPNVISIDKLDLVREERGNKYSRDQGTSFQLQGQWYYLFGDTFCYNSQGQYIKDIVCNGQAKISDITRPTLCRYDGFDSTGKSRIFIPLLADETNIPNSRCTLWAFGGVVETSPGIAWLWAEKSVFNNSNGAGTYYGTVLAKVTADPATGCLSATRASGTIFSATEPRIGTISCVLEGDYVYLFGPSLSTILSRVQKDSVLDRRAYDFWSGTTWVKDYNNGAMLFKDMQHGHVFKSTIFGPGRPWVFIGNNKWLDGKVIIGSAPALTGPWDLQQGPVCQGIECTKETMYCHYPHPWGNKEKDGKILITYCEHYPGNVIAAVVNLEMNPAPVTR